MTSRTGILLACAALTFGGACASGREMVSDQQLARAPASLLTGVNQQRMAVSEARDTLARRELAIQGARKEIQLVKTDLKVSDAELARAKAALDAASFNRDAAGIQRARHEQQAAQAGRDAAQARIRVAEARVSMEEARRDEARQRLQLAEAQLEWEKYQALRNARDPEVNKIDPGALQLRVKDEQRDVREAANTVAQRQADFAREQRAWLASARRYQGLRGYGGAGVGGAGRSSGGGGR